MAEQLLGDILIKQNLVTKDTIDQALRTQIGGNHRLGYILVRMKAITADKLVEVLSKQLDLPICDIPVSFSPSARKIIPRYLCRQYGVLPLSFKSDNILELAMANPSDHSARNDLETYTGKVIEPQLARLSDIEKSISKFIAFNIKDFFSPRFNTRVTRIAVASCLAMLLVLGIYTYNYVYENRYGTVTKTEASTRYKNHDLMLGYEINGQINFIGRGAYSQGHYSVTFPNEEVLKSFLDKRKSDLSEKQQEWLYWVIDLDKQDIVLKSVELAKK